MSRLLFLAITSIATLASGCATTKQDMAHSSASKKERRASIQLESDAARQNSKAFQSRISKINP
ncbi:hypothetical protein [Thermomonas fusca]